MARMTVELRDMALHLGLSQIHSAGLARLRRKLENGEPVLLDGRFCRELADIEEEYG